MELIIVSGIIGTLGYMLSNQPNPKKNNDPQKNIDYDKIYKDNVTEKFIESRNNKQEFYNDADKGGRYISSLTGTEMKKEAFTHNNMTPFFGGSVKQNTYEKSNEPILDSHTGNNRFSLKKTEKKPMFELNRNINNINGTPNMTGEIVDRYLPSQKKTNELPTEQLRVGPGLNQGFTHIPTGGFHQGNKIDHIIPKNIDELRVLTNPKLSYEGRVISGKSVTQNTSKMGTLNKYGPKKFKENTSDDYFTTVGAVTKGKQRATIIVKDTHRKKTASYVGSGAPATMKQTKFNSIYRKPTKQATLSNGVRNAHLVDKWNNKKIADYGKKSIIPTSNEREITGTRTHTSNFTSIVKALVAPIEDTFRTTRKENVIGNIRESGNYNSKHNKQTVYDPNDVARTTIKETNIHNNHSGNMNGPQRLTIYHPNDVTRTTVKETNIHNNHSGNMNGNEQFTVYDPNDVARTTIKETNIHNNHSGNINGPEGLAVYDPNDVTRTTIKETNIHNNHSGNMNGNEHSTVYDPNDVARTTIKETNIHNNHSGNMNGPEGLAVYDPNDVARTTIKETNIHNNHAGNMNGPDRNTIYDPNDVARTTIKETNIHDNRTGYLQSTTNMGSVVKDKNDVARTTNKQTLIDNNYSSNMNGPHKNTIYDPNDVARTTIKETNIDNNHIGNMNGPEGLAVYDPNDVARTTIKETNIEDGRLGISTTENSSGQGYLTNKMEAPNTHKQFLLKEYSGNMDGNTVSKGTGYLIDPAKAPNTNRQFSSSEYSGTAGSKNSKPTSYADVYNATLNQVKEETLKQREPVTSNVSVYAGANNINMASNKVEQDYINTRNPNRTATYDTRSTVENCSITSYKDQLNNDKLADRIQPEILDTLKSNPYSKSLHSYAFN